MQPWLIAYICILLVGVSVLVMLWGEHINQRPTVILTMVFGIPSLCWGLLVGGRWLFYASQQLFAHYWDERHWQDLRQQTQRGRRSLQILHISFRTAFDDNCSERQLSSLMQNEIALKAQRSWQDKDAVRHSRLLMRIEELTEKEIQRHLRSIVDDLAETMAFLPAETSVFFVFESNTELSNESMDRLWQEACENAGISQPVCRVQGSGLSVIDDWLDNHINESALLVVVALQIHPQDPDMTAESAVGLIFGNRLTQRSLIPLAYLHRPELGQRASLGYSVRQALDWVPLAPESVKHAWLSGVSPQNSEAVMKVLEDVSLDVAHDRGLYDLDSSLGHPGCVAPWLAIAAAAQAAQVTSSSQCMFIGAAPPEAGVWSAVVSPYTTSQEFAR
ncbi:hypothetical protein ABK905_00940 [Acerihabitans sp. KWT182]|uniref:Type VI secretion protein n=1 Tax=Acerihabitans sp. KWT182 TaxID=3157919 RepID=A0AAU7QA96_9GAMM